MTVRTIVADLGCTWSYYMDLSNLSTFRNCRYLGWALRTCPDIDDTDYDSSVCMINDPDLISHPYASDETYSCDYTSSYMVVCVANNSPDYTTVPADPSCSENDPILCMCLHCDSGNPEVCPVTVNNEGDGSVQQDCRTFTNVVEYLVPVPTTDPSEAPTTAPSEAPTDAPTGHPTETPTDAPTDAPTETPTDAPTKAPIAACTNGAQDGDETAVDCGGVDCGGCDAGEVCALPRDCIGGTNCQSGTCVANTNAPVVSPSLSPVVSSTSSTDDGLGIGVIAGIAGGVLVVAALVWYWYNYIRKPRVSNKKLGDEWCYKGDDCEDASLKFTPMKVALK